MGQTRPACRGGRVNPSNAANREAIACTRWTWEPPELGIVTFVDAGKVRPKRDPGYCYRCAGFEHVGFTKGGLLAFQLLPDAMPEPCEPLRVQQVLAV